MFQLVTQGNITGYQVLYGSGMTVNVNSPTTTQLTFTAPSLPEGVFTGTVDVMVTAFSEYGVGPVSNLESASITGKIMSIFKFVIVVMCR